MALLKTEAVILHSRKFSESSKIIVLFTRTTGRVSVLVKGGRKGTKKFPGGLETLNWVELQFYHRPGRELHNFKSSDLIQGFPHLRTDLSRTYTALSLAETILRVTMPEDENPHLLDDLTETFAALDSIESNPWTLRWRALLHIARHLGFSLDLRSCVGCGAGNDITAFDLPGGGFLCRHCGEDRPHTIKAGAEMWGALRFLDRCPPAAAPRMTVTPAVGMEIEALFSRFFRFHVPGLKKFDSWKLLSKLYWGIEAKPYDG
jgi:DNA repair protein RecO (recombination protein O)